MITITFPGLTHGQTVHPADFKYGGVNGLMLIEASIDSPDSPLSAAMMWGLNETASVPEIGGGVPGVSTIGLMVYLPTWAKYLPGLHSVTVVAEDANGEQAHTGITLNIQP